MIRLLTRFFCSIPLIWALRIARGLGWIWYYLIPIRWGVARRNIERALGDEVSKAERRRILKRCFGQVAMFAVDGIRLRQLTAESAREMVRVENAQLMDELLARGKGVVGFTAHVGAIDVGVCAEALRGIPLNIIYKDIKWAPAQKLWYEIRSRTGLKHIAPRRSKNNIRAALARGEVVGFAIDQHMAAHRAVVCSFFGKLASTTPAPVRFAIEAGAPILAVVAYRNPDNVTHVVRYGPEIKLEMPYDDLEENIRHNTERLNRVVEGWIREFPEQWLWLHKRWKVDDDPSGWSVPPALQSLMDAPRGGSAKPTARKRDCA
jgi:KDO2-lipid IV(A) lauroyltransferase